MSKCKKDKREAKSMHYICQILAGQPYDWLEQTKGMQMPLKRTIKKAYGDWRHPNQD